MRSTTYMAHTVADYIPNRSFAKLHFSQDAAYIGSKAVHYVLKLSYFFTMLSLWTNPLRLKQAIYLCSLRALPAMMQWIRSQRPGESGVNIITADFVELGEFISAVITLNYYLDDEEENATWTSKFSTSLVVSITCSLFLCHIFMFYLFIYFRVVDHKSSVHENERRDQTQSGGINSGFVWGWIGGRWWFHFFLGEKRWLAFSHVSLLPIYWTTSYWFTCSKP